MAIGDVWNNSWLNHWIGWAIATISSGPGKIIGSLIDEITWRNTNEGPGKELIFHGDHERVNNLVASSKDPSSPVVLTRVHPRIAKGTST